MTRFPTTKPNTSNAYVKRAAPWSQIPPENTSKFLSTDVLRAKVSGAGDRTQSKEWIHFPAFSVVAG